MFRSFYSLLFVLLLSFCAKNSSISLNEAITIHTSLDSIAKSHHLLGMSAVLIEDGSIRFSHFTGFGKADSSLKISGDTQFRIASISKLATTLAIMKLWEQGKLDLDKDVSDYLGWTLRNPAFPDKIITTRYLISHLSSIRDGEGYGNFVDKMISDQLDIRELFLPNGAYFTADIFSDSLEPGKYFSYSNSAFGLVATLVEKISGERFDIYTHNTLFKPLTMKASFNVMTADLSNLATLYRSKDGKWNSQTDDYSIEKPSERAYESYSPGKNGLLYGPQGSLRISTNDLITLSKLFFNDLPPNQQVLAKSTIDTMLAFKWVYSKKEGLENGDTWDGFWFSYGMGLHRLSGNDGDNLLNGTPLFGHPGIAYGLLSDFYLNRESKTGVIFITNGSLEPFKTAKGSGFYQVEIDVARELSKLFRKKN
jgi:CubicO group peptidase (beta-lactamase class C family)